MSTAAPNKRGYVEINYDQSTLPTHLQFVMVLNMDGQHVKCQYNGHEKLFIKHSGRLVFINEVDSWRPLTSTEIESYNNKKQKHDRARAKRHRFREGEDL